LHPRLMSIPPPKSTANNNAFDDLDDDGWQDMPIIRASDNTLGLDEEDAKRYHYVEPKKRLGDDTHGGNATGNLIDYDDRGNEWRSKLDQNEDDYTRLKLDDDDEADEVHLRTRYLFDEDKAMTPLSQMQATKDLLTEAQRIAYVGVCALASREMVISLRKVKSKELKTAINNLELWSLKIMGRLYYHMELETAAENDRDSSRARCFCDGPCPSTHDHAYRRKPEYDPAEARRKDAENALARQSEPLDEDYDITSAGNNEENTGAQPVAPKQKMNNVHLQTTANVMEPLTPTVSTMPGVSTSLSTTDENVILDIRWTVLCDLFLILIADSVYDSRSRVLLENVATKLGLGWIDVVKFEKRVTEALEIQEGIERLEQTDVIEGRSKSAAKKRYMMMGLATLDRWRFGYWTFRWLLAPVIGLGLGAALGTVGITGTTGFLTGAGGAALITTGGVLSGSSIAGRGMAKRTRQVKTFSLLPIHNNKRVNCIIAVPGYLAHDKDDPRLPFSVLDPVIGDAFGILWEPEMMAEMGNALKILTSEVLTQVGQTVLQATVMAALMSALQWPLILTKLGYLIDNPWSNALDRARAAGLVLADDVFLLGATVAASTQQWLQVRGAVAGRLVNCFARNDWLLNYLFRATTAGIGTVAGLRPVENVPGLENVDVTDKILGHLSYRTFIPLIMDQLGFPVTSTYFDEPEEPEMEGDRIVVREPPQPVVSPPVAPPPKKRFSWFSRNKSTPPEKITTSGLQEPATRARTVSTSIPKKRMMTCLKESLCLSWKPDLDPTKIRMPQPSPAMKATLAMTPRNEPMEIGRSESAPPASSQTQIIDLPERETTPKPRAQTRAQTEYGADVLGAGPDITTTRTRVSEPEEDDGEDVTAMFQRSTSLDSTSGLGLSSEGRFAGGYIGDLSGQGDDSVSKGFGSPRFAEESTISFGAAGSSTWSLPANPFATPSTSSLAGGFGSSSPFGTSYIAPTPPNPFSESKLSFGASDENVTSWPTQPTKKPSLPSNPWET
ncbi:hypothetical protein RHS01_06773, partial [Rhizoctonia solani]